MWVAYSHVIQKMCASGDGSIPRPLGPNHVPVDMGLGAMQFRRDAHRMP